MMRANRKLSVLLLAGVAGAYACSSSGRNGNVGGSGGSDEEGGSAGSDTPTGGSSGGKGGASSGGSGGSTTSGGSGGDSSGGSGGSTSEPDASAGGSGGGDTGGSGGGGGSDSGGSGGAGGSGQGGTGGSPPISGMPHVVLLYSNDHNAADPSYKEMMAIMNGMKDRIVPEFVLDSDPGAKAAMLMTKGLVIVGPNTRACSNGVDTAIKNLPIPVMISKDCTSWSGLGNMMNTGNTENSINITNGDHPLAAGLKGKVRVFTDSVCRLVRGAGLGPDAIKIAAFDATSWNIFAYEKGGTMAGGFKAPAKRVGFYWHRPSGATPEGKKLFEAAITWLVTP
jgi:hypothetical protein